MTMASSDQNERVASRSPLAAVRAQSRLVCMSAARSDSRFITPRTEWQRTVYEEHRVLVPRVVCRLSTASTKTTLESVLRRREGITDGPSVPQVRPKSGGVVVAATLQSQWDTPDTARRWWAHFAFTRINTEPIIP